jgi:hypothetical protein
MKSTFVSLQRLERDFVLGIDGWELNLSNAANSRWVTLGVAFFNFGLALNVLSPLKSTPW